MKIYVVTKAPVGLYGAPEMIGAYGSTSGFNRMISTAGPGTYQVHAMDIDRTYRGDLRDVSVKLVVDHREVCEGLSPSDCLIRYREPSRFPEAKIESVQHLPTGTVVRFCEDERVTKSAAIERLGASVQRSKSAKL